MCSRPTRQTTKQPAHADISIGQAWALRHAGRTADAARICRQALERNPDDDDALFLLSSLDVAAGRPGEALGPIERLLGRHAEQAEVHELKGLALQGLRRHVEAADAFRQATTLQPGNAEAWSNLGNALQDAGLFAEAVSAYRQARDAGYPPEVVSYNLGNLFRRFGKTDDAIRHYRESVAHNPSYAYARNNLGILLHQQGRLDEAGVELRKAVELQPDLASAHVNLGNVYQEQGLLDDAERSFRRALTLKPGHAEALSSLGRLMNEKGDRDLALRYLEEAIAARPDFPEALNGLANILQARGEVERALALYDRALTIEPDLCVAREGRAKTLQRVVPRWHFPMMNDESRNLAYLSALRRAVRPDSVVLDIGAGSGLLAMMAARCGAREVVSCETVRPVASKAKEIVARNGLADRVTIVSAKSTQLAVGKDLPRRADVLVTEIFDAGLLGENALPTLAHAREYLLAQGARLIPYRAVVLAALIDSIEIYRATRVSNDNACGFDLEGFNDFATTGYEQCDIRRYAHRLLCAPQAVFDFDFRSPVPNRAVDLQVPILESGTMHAIAFWFRLHLDEETALDTGPLVERTCWQQSVIVPEKPRPVEAGQSVTLRASHTQQQIAFSVLA